MLLCQTVSGLVKLLHPDGKCAIRLIPEGPLPPGDIFSVGVDPGTDRVALFRIQAASVAGNGRFNLVGVTSKDIRESAKMAFDYLRANAKRVGLERDFGGYDLNIQVMSPMQGRDTPDLGVAFFIAILSAMVGRNIGAGLVVLGQMSIHGVFSRIDNLADRLRVAMDAGAACIGSEKNSTRSLSKSSPGMLPRSAAWGMDGTCLRRWLPAAHLNLEAPRTPDLSTRAPLDPLQTRKALVRGGTSRVCSAPPDLDAYGAPFPDRRGRKPLLRAARAAWPLHASCWRARRGHHPRHPLSLQAP